MRRAWPVPVATAVLAVGFLVAGAVAWRMTAMPSGCPTGEFCALLERMPRPHQIHPLRAELLLAVGAALALITLARVASVAARSRSRLQIT